MKTLAFGVFLLLHGGLLLGWGGGLWRFEICMRDMEKREPALGAPSMGMGRGLEKGLQGPPIHPPQNFGSPVFSCAYFVSRKIAFPCQLVTGLPAYAGGQGGKNFMPNGRRSMRFWFGPLFMWVAKMEM